MRKWIIVTLFLLLSFSLAACTQTTEEPDETEEAATTLVVHYYRPNGDYDTWSLWLWPQAPESLDGDQYFFDNFTEEGAQFTLELDGAFEGVTSVGVIVRGVDNWNKDVEVDLFIDVTNPDEDGVVRAFLVQGVPEVFYNFNDALAGRSAEITFASFRDERTIEFRVTAVPDADAVSVQKDGNDVAFEEVEFRGTLGLITLEDAVSNEEGYQVTIDFGREEPARQHVLSRVIEHVIDDPRLEASMVDDNYRVYYQIFVGSFSDSTGDGKGDLRGIINRLDYLNDGDPNSGESLGITGIWLTPIMPSPTYHKYDTTDFMAIDPDFGTLDDFAELISEADARGIDIIIDLVLNHTSSQHPWFIEALEAAEAGEWDNPYLDYYLIVHQDDKVSNRTYYHFYGDFYYEAAFWSEMPELNLESEALREEIEAIVAFWFDLGVKGFRLDAAKHLFLNDHERTLDSWRWFMEVVTDIREDAYVVGEVWDSNHIIRMYYEVFNNFDFGMSGPSGRVASTVNGQTAVDDFVTYLYNYKNSVKDVNPEAILQPFVSNHDMDRAAGYLSPEEYRMHMAANLYILSYGTPFIYYGEEIAMTGNRQHNTDANRRLAMRWGDGDTTMDPVGTTWDEELLVHGTVREHLDDPDSLYNHYKELIMLRHANPEIARGEMTPVLAPDHERFGGFLSTWENSTVGVFHNTGTESITIDLSELTDHAFSVLRGAVGQGGATLDGSLLTIDARTTVVLK